MKNVFELLQAMEAVSPIEAHVSIRAVDSDAIRLVWLIPKWRLLAEGIRSATDDIYYDRYISLVEYQHIDRHLNDIKNSLRKLFEEAGMK